MKYITTIGEREYTIQILDDDQISVDGVVYHVDFECIGGQPLFSLLVDGDSYEAYVYPDEDRWEVHLLGLQYHAIVEDEREKQLRLSFGGSPEQAGEYYLKAPMPGLVISIPVSDGQQVKQGDVLVVLESMKMQNELKAPRVGKIFHVRVKEGDSVERKQTLLSVI